MAKNLIEERLKAMNESKKDLKQDKPNIVESIATGEDNRDKLDFEKLATIIEQQHGEKSLANDNYTKDTIYIRNDLFKAMQAICPKYGDKRIRVNEAFEMYLTKVYKEMNIDLTKDGN